MPPRQRPPRNVGQALELAPLADIELAALDDDDKHAEAFMLSITGYSIHQIAQRFAVDRKTIRQWIHKYLLVERTRKLTIEEAFTEAEMEFNAVQRAAWAAYNSADIDQLAAPNYLRLIFDAAKAKATLRGLDKIGNGDASRGTTEVVVEIGGEQKARIGVRTT